MRRALLLHTLLLPGLTLGMLAGCPGTRVPEQDRLRATRELSGAHRFLRVALFAGPFFADRQKALASDQPFAELELLDTGAGQTISPPRAERVLPPGTPVVIRDVEFPTGWTVASRIVLTPRWNVWVYLEVPGETRPVILVLPGSVATFEDVEVQLDRVLSTFDPTPQLAALGDFQRKAVERKDVVEGMGPAAVAMAWGAPERKILDRPAAKEQWIWPGGRRKAWLEDGQLVRFEAR
jgi:hypothetical protein